MPYSLHPSLTQSGAEPHDPRRGGRVVTMVPQYDAMGRPPGAMVEAPSTMPANPWELVLQAAKTADDGMRMVANGMTFGQADRLAGLGDYAMGRAESYDAGAKAQFERTDKVREEHPYMAPAAELAGGLITGGGLFKNGATLVGREGMALLPRMMAGAVEGGAYGAATGAGNTHSDRIEDYVDAAYKELQTGALLGAGLPLLGSAAGKGVKWAAEKTGLDALWKGVGSKGGAAAGDAQAALEMKKPMGGGPDVPEEPREVHLWDEPELPFEAEYTDPAVFNADYPGKPWFDSKTGKLKRDMEKLDIVAKYIVGRSYKDQPNKGLDFKEMMDAIKLITAKSPTEVPPFSMGRKTDTLGRTIPDPDYFPSVEIANNLQPDEKTLVLAHEFGHVIDEIVGGISIAGLEDELKPLYHYTATGKRYNPNIDNLYTPEMNGYRNIDNENMGVDKEYVAEAVRAYLVSPNTLKTIAPETAKRIRQFANKKGDINRVVHFNSVPLVLGGGAAGYAAMMGGGGTEDASAGTFSDSMPRRPNDAASELQRALMERGGY